MPIESSGSGTPEALLRAGRGSRAAPGSTGASARGRRRTAGRPSGPADLQVRAGERGPGERLGVFGGDTRLRRFPSDVDLEKHGQRSALPLRAGPPVARQVFPDLGFRWLRSIVAPSSPCWSEEVRSAARRGPESAPGRASIFPAPSATRFSPKRSKPARRGARRRARPGAPCVTARSATSFGSRPAAPRGARRCDERTSSRRRRELVRGRAQARVETAEDFSLASAPRLASRSAFVFFSRGTWVIAKRRKPFARRTASAKSGFRCSAP